MGDLHKIYISFSNRFLSHTCNGRFSNRKTDSFSKQIKADYNLNWKVLNDK